MRNFGREFLEESFIFENKTCLIWRDREISFKEFHEYIGKWKKILDEQKTKAVDVEIVIIFQNS